MIKIFRR